MKNIIKILSVANLTAMLSLQASAILACTCLYGGEFAEKSKSYSTVIRAKVIEHGDILREEIHKSITVEVSAVIKGDLDRSKLKLIGDRGTDCREYANSRKYEIGKEFLFVM